MLSVLIDFLKCAYGSVYDILNLRIPIFQYLKGAYKEDGEYGVLVSHMFWCQEGGGQLQNQGFGFTLVQLISLLKSVVECLGMIQVLLKISPLSCCSFSGLFPMLRTTGTFQAFPLKSDLTSGPNRLS